jgi:hypothetical protein
MSFTHKLTRSWSKSGATPVSAEIEKTGGSEANISESIPDSSSDLEVNWTCDYTALELLYITSDQDITIETNDGTYPDDTLTINANQAVSWADGDEFDCPLTADVTALFVTNASGLAAQLEIRSLTDPTP